MFNFQPSPELMKQMLGGMGSGMSMGQPMTPQMNHGPMPGQGLDVGMGMSNTMPMPRQMMQPPMAMPPAQPQMPMRKPTGNAGGKPKGIMANYGQNNPNKRRVF
jgi:hypothetical protein